MADEVKEAAELSVAEMLGEVSVPPELESAFQRHRQNLIELVRNLRSAGVSEEQIEQSVSVIVASYKEELLRTMKAIAR